MRTGMILRPTSAHPSAFCDRSTPAVAPVRTAAVNATSPQSLAPLAHLLMSPDGFTRAQGSVNGLRATSR